MDVWLKVVELSEEERLWKWSFIAQYCVFSREREPGLQCFFPIERQFTVTICIGTVTVDCTVVGFWLSIKLNSSSFCWQANHT